MVEIPTGDLELLEATIDQYGAVAVVGAIAQICRDKGEHLRTNWQDSDTAKCWDDLAKRLERASAKAEV